MQLLYPPSQLISAIPSWLKYRVCYKCAVHFPAAPRLTDTSCVAPGVLARLPLEIRLSIYDLMLKRTHRFVCFGTKLTFVRAMDLSPPRIAFVCHEMRAYALRRYEAFSVTCYKRAVKHYLYTMQQLPLSRYVDLKLEEFEANAIEKRYTAWFSTAYDTIEVQPGYGHFGDHFYVWQSFGSGDSVDFLGRRRWVGATGELLPSWTIDHPETDFHRLLKTKRDATARAAQLVSNPSILLG